MQVPVGRVLEVSRYPVKSMAGEALAVAQVDWQGIEGDRQFAFYRVEDGTRFPWQTARELPDLVRHAARFREPLLARTSPVEIEAPDGSLWDLRDPDFLARMSDAAGCELGLMQLGRGTYDAMPISIVTTTTHATLDRICGAAIDARRFRSNILIEADVPETSWLGCRVTFGDRADSAELLVAEGIERCAMITIDPDTAVRDPALMRVVVQEFDNRFGAYCAPARPGTIQPGDLVYVAG
jgi:hypothetical protein